MSRRSSKRKVERYPWGNGNNLDFSMLQSLSAVASSFENTAAPDLETLDAFSKSLNQLNCDNNENEEEDDDEDELDNENVDEKLIPSSKEFNQRDRNLDDESSIGDLKANRRKKARIDQNQNEIVPLSIFSPPSTETPIKQEKEFIPNDEPSWSRARAFFSQLQKFYGPRYGSIAKSFIDSLQRFLKAEISEMALLSILRYLFHEAPDILKIFDEFTQLNVFGAVAPVPNMDEGRIASLNSDGAAKVSPLKSVNAVKNALGVNNLNNSNNVPGVASNSKGVTNGINSHPAQGTKRVANDLNIEEDGDGAKGYLRKLKLCMEAPLYQKILDLLLEIRYSYRTSAGSPYPQLSTENVQKILTIKELIPVGRDDLRTLFDIYFPLHEIISDSSSRSNSTMQYIPFTGYSSQSNSSNNGINLANINAFGSIGNFQNKIAGLDLSGGNGISPFLFSRSSGIPSSVSTTGNPFDQTFSLSLPGGTIPFSLLSGYSLPSFQMASINGQNGTPNSQLGANLNNVTGNMLSINSKDDSTCSGTNNVSSALPNSNILNSNSINNKKNSFPNHVVGGLSYPLGNFVPFTLGLNALGNPLASNINTITLNPINALSLNNLNPLSMLNGNNGNSGSDSSASAAINPSSSLSGTGNVDSLFPLQPSFENELLFKKLNRNGEDPWKDLMDLPKIGEIDKDFLSRNSEPIISNNAPLLNNLLPSFSSREASKDQLSQIQSLLSSQVQEQEDKPGSSN